jgi:hypothetical protein
VAEFAPRKGPDWVDKHGRHFHPVRNLREGQTFVIMTQERFSFSILMLTIETLTRRAGVASIKVRPNNYGIIEIAFDEEATVIVLPTKG